MEGVPQKSISNGGHKNGKPKRKKIKIDWICINPDCTKSRSDNVITAKPFVISYFGAKMDEKRKRKVCRDCYVQAKVTTDAMVAKLMSKESVITEPLPTVHDAAVILDDSDEDDLAKTDSSDDSELEFELENETLESLVEDTLKKFGLTEQLDGAIESLTQRLGAINPDVQEIDANFASIEKQVDDMRKALYAPFKPEIKHLPPLIIQDNSSQVPIPSSGGASSTVTNPNLTALPPVGVLNRPPLKLNDKVIAMRGNILNVWKDGSVNEISTLPQDETNPYKIRFEVWMSGRLKNAHHRKLQLKHIAYTVPATVKLQVGTRIIGVYTDPENPTSTTDFYSGIVAEPPKTMNALRYLVFFDDGYASYIRHEDLRVVCQQTENAVWEDIHPNSRDFVKKYLMQYPERPMVKLSIGQPVTVEWEGSWWHAKVEGVDASLVKVVFAVNSRREAIYRGSTRLGPLYKQMQQQKRSAEIGAKFSRRNHTANRGGRPYVEYTKLTDENSLSMQQSLAAVNAALGVTPAGPQQEMPKRATARKSTAGNKKNDLLPSSRPDPNRPKWESKGSVRDLEVEIVEGVNFIKHQCSPLCMDDTKFLYDENKIITKDEKLKHFNPLLVPVILGWKRQITKHKNFGKRSVYYVSPCGRRLRNLEEIHRYLRVTHSTLEIDFFNFEWYVQVYKFFTPERKFYQIDDISYGKENVQVSCVNSLDNNYPEYVEYSTVRLPQKNVDIPMSEGFLTCCDCTDDCQDKDRCACWQLTISSTAASNPDATVNPNVGCEYRRLHEPVSTGIYECNQYCKCKKTCLNRIAQHPIRAQLQVFKTERRGWGIRTLCHIPKGAFICIYVGNLYTNEEANKQGQDFGDEYFAELDLIEVVEGRKEGYESDYEGDVEVLSDDADYKANDSSDDNDECEDATDGSFGLKMGLKCLNLSTASSQDSDRQTRQRKKATDDSKKEDGDGKPDGEEIGEKEKEPKLTSTRKYFHKDEDFYVMDAKSIGNIGRYLNHSCNPNCFVQNCFVDTHDLRFPWVAFFSNGHIQAGEELCWDYNYQVDQVQGKEIYCQCAAENCRGRLL